MRFKSLILAIFCVLSISQFLYSKTNQDSYRYHTVNKGETIYSIAKLYNVPVHEIYELNPQTERGIRVKESLKIPAVTAKKPKDEQGYVLHSIQPKETLYSVSKHYNISINDIIEANNGLTSENFKIGNAIRIPTKQKTKSLAESLVSNKGITHKVIAKETLYSISKLYNISVEQIAEANPDLKENGLKKDMELLIPIGNATSAPANSTLDSKPSLLYEMTAKKSTGIMRIGLLLPFLDKQEYQQARFVEFYEGFLLAIEEMKSKGYSIDLYAFDIRKGNNTQKLKSLLGTIEMQNLDLIIGGVNDEEIALISEFTRENNIEYAVPFPVRNEEVIKNPKAFQSNVLPTHLYPKVADIFSKQFNNCNIIILADEDNSNNDKRNFISVLNNRLSNWAIPHQTIVIDSKLSTSLKTALSSSKKNIIIPASSSLITLSKIMPAIRTVKKQSPSIDIGLFGYPDWQTYSVQFLDDFFKYDTYIFSSFYVNNNDPQTHQFMEKFRNWYGKNLINTYPKYGILGYDTGLYFITALFKGDGHLQGNIPNNEIPTIQSVFYFNNYNQAGNINTGLYFVHYKTDMTIEKIDHSK